MKVILLIMTFGFGFMTEAGTMTKREFQKEGVTYIEEVVIGENRNISKSIYPKRGQERSTSTHSPLTSATTAMPELKPLPLHPPKKVSQKPAKALYSSIAACKPYHFSMQHPVTPGFVIEVQVHGLQKKKCKFTQTMPEDQLQTCLFSEKQRRDIGQRGEAAFESLLLNPTTCTISAH